MGLFTIWKQVKPSNTIELGGNTVEVKPLTLENSLRLMLLLAPYIVALEYKWPQIKEALESTNGKRPQLLQTIFVQLRQDFAFSPDAIVQALGLLLDKDVGYIAEHATAKDLLKAWPVLDQINSFGELWEVTKRLGIVVQHKEK